MWLSRVWSERCESHKEQNKAFKLLKLFLSKETELFKKEKRKRTEQNSLKKTKQRRKRKGLRPVKKKTKNSELQTNTVRRSL